MKHGPDSKYWHIRLQNPKTLENMKTVPRGPVKQVTGINKEGHWIDQNIMVKKTQAKKKGSKLVITSVKVKKWMKDHHYNPSAIKPLKGGGEADFIIKGKA